MTTHPSPAYEDDKGIWCCGEDFMAGTICSLAPDHEGPHAAGCQACGGDWMLDTCECYKRCNECGTAIYLDTVDAVSDWCDDCRCPGVGSTTIHEGEWVEWRCKLEDAHVGSHDFMSAGDLPGRAPTDEELAEAYESIGAARRLIPPVR